QEKAIKVGKLAQARSTPRRRIDRTKSGVRMTGILSEVSLSGGLQVACAPKPAIWPRRLSEEPLNPALRVPRLTVRFCVRFCAPKLLSPIPNLPAEGMIE